VQSSAADFFFDLHIPGLGSENTGLDRDMWNSVVLSHLIHPIASANCSVLKNGQQACTKVVDLGKIVKKVKANFSVWYACNWHMKVMKRV